MAYITGSVTDANPGPALYALMAPALTTAGLTLVDTVVISTRTHKVWKSAAASNVQNLDWYLDVAYTTTGAATISLVAFEMYDPATDLGYRGPYAGATNTIDATTYSRFGATGSALESNWIPNASSAAIQTSLTTTAFGYWITVTSDRVILLCSGAPSAVMYAGFYRADPLHAAKAGAGLYPLISGLVGGSSTSANLGLTRIPPWTALSGGATWANGSVDTPASNFINPQPRVPADPTTGYPFTAVPIALHSAGAASRMGRWGWYRDVFMVPAAAVVRGDTCTIDSASHVFATTTAAASYAFKAA